jgi:serine/threonine kinase 38
MTNSSTESPLRFSCHTLDKATKAKVTLENYYSNLISQHRERRERLRRLEESLQVTREIEEIGGELTGSQRD